VDVSDSPSNTDCVHDREAALFDALATTLAAPDVEAALEAALREIAEALELAAAWIWLRDPATGFFYLAAAHELPPYLREPVQMTGDPCWCIEAFEDGDFDSHNVDIIACSRLRRGEREAGERGTLGLQSHASVALRFGERRLGIMNLCPPPKRRLSEGELRLLDATGAQLGLAVERARLAEHETNAARSDERTRLAREIHDTLAQDLTAIALQLESALRDAPPESPQARRIATALEVARASLRRARSSVVSLRTDPLEGRPLPTALAALARRTTSETGIRVAFRRRGDVTLPYETEGELFRIASEAIANGRLHAGATQIEARLEGDDDGVTLRVSDDGRGFEPSAREEERYGIRGMEERARLVGAELRIESHRGAGTIVVARVPRVRR
jgi:two-component system NarL family sensor kinase